MLDRDRVLSKIDELRGYLRELKQIAPSNFSEFKNSIENRRACERILHISIESVLDICSLIISGLRLGLPRMEGDLIEKLRETGVISEETAGKIRLMRGFRNILVHRYGEVDDSLVYRFLQENLKDFDTFSEEILAYLRERLGSSR